MLVGGNCTYSLVMASSTRGYSITVNSPDDSIGIATPATVESIGTDTVTATPSQVEVSKPQASGKNQSDYWQYFTKRLDLIPPKVECKHCKTKFSWGKDHGTTNMNNHIKQRRFPNLFCVNC
ncbi:hypothetical protein MKX03_006451 [Papaver bracteatum]|nr:hypothetical protein MKX03_006451 [Papaver bracteatum]